MIDPALQTRDSKNCQSLVYKSNEMPPNLKFNLSHLQEDSYTEILSKMEDLVISIFDKNDIDEIGQHYFNQGGYKVGGSFK